MTLFSLISCNCNYSVLVGESDYLEVVFREVFFFLIEKSALRAYNALVQRCRLARSLLHLQDRPNVAQFLRYGFNSLYHTPPDSTGDRFIDTALLIKQSNWVTYSVNGNFFEYIARFL